MELIELSINAIRRLNEAPPPELLQNDEVPVMENVVLRESGSLFFSVKRGAFRIWNSNACPETIRQLFEAVDSAGEDFLFALAGQVLYKSKHGTEAFSVIRSGLPAECILTMTAAYDAACIFTSKDTPPFIVYGEAFQEWRPLELEIPDVSALCTGLLLSGEGALNTNAAYQYCFVYRTQVGWLSAPSRPFTHIAINGTGVHTTDGTHRGIGLANIPPPTDNRIAEILLFRTKANENIFYYHSALPASQTEFTDLLSDDALDTARTIVYTSVPLHAGAAALHAGRLFFGDIRISKRCRFEPASTRTVLGALDPALYEAGDCFRCTVTSGGSVGLGLYRYRIYFMDVEGNESAHYSEVAAEVTAADRGVWLIRIPSRTRDLQQYIEHKRIYRTKANGTVYYLLATLPSSDDTFFDTVNDTELTALRAEPESTVDIPNGLAFSDLDKHASFPLENILRMPPHTGSPITSFLSAGEELFLFQNNACGKLSTFQAPFHWRVTVLSESEGFDSGLCSSSGAGMFGISGKKVLRFSPQTGFTEIGIPISISLGSAAGISTAFDSETNCFFYAARLNGSRNVIFCFDAAIETWYLFTVPETNCLIVKKFGSSAGSIISAFGKILSRYTSPSEYAADQTAQGEVPIQTLLSTKTFLFPDGIARVKPRFLFVHGEGQNISHRIYSPNDETERTCVSGFGKIIIAGMQGTLSSASSLFYEVKNFETFHGMRLQFRPERKGLR